MHDLRHTAASMAFDMGMEAPNVSEMLGHSSTAMTLDLYTHLLPSRRTKLANKMGTLLRAVS